MARRGMNGQLNMFDYFRSLESEPIGEVEMVSLVPEFEEEPQPVAVESKEVKEEIPVVEEDVPEDKMEIPETKKEYKKEDIAMSRRYTIGGAVTEIAYINYNKVRITKGDAAPIIKEFASTKEAVDYYVEQMQELEADE